MQNLQAHDLRVCVGVGTVTSWDYLLPRVVHKNGTYLYHIPVGSLLRFRRKNQTAVPLKRERGLKYFSDRQKSILKHLLESHIGLTRKSATVLLSRPVHQFMRIEEFISGLVDSLVTADIRLFADANWTHKFRAIVRNCFKVGSYNCPILVTWWKEFTSSFFHKWAETSVYGEIKTISRENIFRDLQNLEATWGFSKPFKYEHVHYMKHLISTRQMPFMAGDTIKKAIDEFYRVVQEPFITEPAHLFRMRQSAKRIGRICKTIAGDKKPDKGIFHYSVTSSGSYETPVSEGGSAARTWDAFKKRMSEVPTETFMEDTPFGPVSHEKGIPLWKTAFSDPKIPPMFRFGGLELGVTKDISPLAPVQTGGLTDRTGIQIQYCAWKDYCPTPVVRAEVVPEMGNKARIVTCGDYYLQPLQAPISHLMKWYMGFHPSAYSSLKRCDQAWESLKLVTAGEYIEGHEFLSSDLKNATNAMPFDIAKAMAEGFLEGIGVSLDDPQVQIFLSTIGERLIYVRPRDEHIIMKRGVMMGEAIAKPLLTLLNLSVEELAFCDYVGYDIMTEKEGPAPKREWRAYHVGGDDHLARGPRTYLSAITDNHVKSGSMISVDKHGTSKIMVQYTEQILYVANAKNCISFKEINTKTNQSIWVDGVKVRLLEKGQSTQLLKDDRNVAFGKAIQLSRTLEWQKPPEWAQMVLNLFVKRMGNLIPNASDTKFWALIKMPPEYGGLNLGVQEDIYAIANACPNLVRGVLWKVALGQSVTKEILLLKTLHSNSSMRGSKLAKAKYDAIYARLLDAKHRGPANIKNNIEPITWQEVVSRYPGYADNREIVNAAEKDGILTYEEFAKRQSRGTLFADLMVNKPARADLFETTPYEIRYRRIYWRLKELVEPYLDDTPFTKENFPNMKRALRMASSAGYVQVTEPTLKSPFGKVEKFVGQYSSGLLAKPVQIRAGF